MNLQDMTEYMNDNASGRQTIKNFLYLEFLMNYGLLTIEKGAGADSKADTFLVNNLLITPAKIDKNRVDYKISSIDDINFSLSLYTDPKTQLTISKTPTPISQIKELNSGRVALVGPEQGTVLGADSSRELESIIGSEAIKTFNDLSIGERAQEYFSKLLTETAVFKFGSGLSAVRYTLTALKGFEITYRYANEPHQEPKDC